MHAAHDTVVLAHRLATGSQADRIVVLADGQVAEIGAHNDLLQRDDANAAMWAAFTGEAELVS
jgi:ABC-type transport system involved in Fe-S cluster assembly fused permease/ATPase subunit